MPDHWRTYPTTGGYRGFEKRLFKFKCPYLPRHSSIPYKQVPILKKGDTEGLKTPDQI